MNELHIIETTRKRLFIGLISAACFLVCLLLALIWIVPSMGLDAFHHNAKWVLGAILLALGGLVCWAYWGLFLNIVLKRPIPGARRFRGMTIKLFLPLMVMLGRLLGIEKRAILLSFISVNNELVLTEAKKYSPDKILLLMPHCLQNSRCDRRLTYDINNCSRCGKCPIAALLRLHDTYGVHLAIATGGTIARRIVVQLRPKLIIAVACQRDLASGIQDTYPLPVYGVLNQLPHGPCLDTTVAIPAVEQALHRFLLTKTEGSSKGKAFGTGQAADLEQ